MTGLPAWLPQGGQLGGALDCAGYDGSDDYVQIPNSASLEDVQEGDYTLCAWGRPDSVPAGTGEANNAYYALLTKPGNHLGLLYQNDRRFQFCHWLANGTMVSAATADAYAAGAYRHVAGVLDRSRGTLTIYVDGKAAGSASFAAQAAAREYGTASWRIGIAAPGAATWRWALDGAVDDVRIYARCLSAAEVQTLATAVNRPPSVQLTAPEQGAIFTAPATVELAASASDPDGSVARVEFFSGATKLGEDTTAPFAFSWNGVPAGTYTLVAKATDDRGAVATSATVGITVRAPAVIGNGNGLLGEYYDDAFLGVPRFCRTDAQVDFEWGMGSPDARIAPDTFSVRWTGQVQAQYDETYTFHTFSDDGVRLWVDGQLLVDRWIDQGVTEWRGTIRLEAGRKYDLRMEYYENGGGATARLAWSSPSTPLQLVPQSQLYATALRTPEDPVGAKNGLDYAYFHGDWDRLPDFAALTPVKTGTVSDFNLSPRTRNDQFAFRFAGYVEAPYDGRYTFSTESDDGSRLYIGSTLVVDNDGEHALREASGGIGLKAGRHAIVLTFFERLGSEALRVRYEGPGLGRQEIPVGRLYRVEPASGDGWLATYFDNEDFSGRTVTRLDPAIGFDWGTNAPVAGIEADTFSVRWTGYLVPPATGTYTFVSRTDDGVRLWVGEQPVLNNWQVMPATETSGSVALVAGQRYRVVMEYFEGPIHAVAQLFWSGPGIARQIVPQKHVYSK